MNWEGGGGDCGSFCVMLLFISNLLSCYNYPLLKLKQTDTMLLLPYWTNRLNYKSGHLDIRGGREVNLNRVCFFNI